MIEDRFLKLKQEFYNSLPYNEYLYTDHWRMVRQLVLQRDDRECLFCGKRTTLQIHHNTYDHRGVEEFHLDDLITVCSRCHKKIHKL